MSAESRMASFKSVRAKGKQLRSPPHTHAAHTHVTPKTKREDVAVCIMGEPVYHLPFLSIESVEPQWSAPTDLKAKRTLTSRSSLSGGVYDQAPEKKNKTVHF